MIDKQELIEWGSALLVVVCGALAGHYASLGMSPVQMAGAAVAVLGSVTVAVAVRVWPVPAKVEARSRDWGKRLRNWSASCSRATLSFIRCSTLTPSHSVSALASSLLFMRRM